jgi:hypothetical protein
MIIELTREPNVIEVFTAVIYECLKKAWVWDPDKPFQPSLVFSSKTRAYPGSWLDPITLDQAEIFARDKQHSSLLKCL